MKLTSKILLAMLFLLLVGLLSSNIILKKQYDRIDKTDIYWTYKKIIEEPFKYVKLNGGNGTKIVFEQSPKYSVRILQEWERYHGGKISARIANDTLYIDFNYIPSNLYEKFWIKGITAIRLFAPELLSVAGSNTNFEMLKLKQKSIDVLLTGKSKFEIESLTANLDSVNIIQRDSSEVVFEMAPEYESTNVSDPDRVGVSFTNKEQIKSSETMYIHRVSANLQGLTLLDLGHAQIDSLNLEIADSSAVIISGGALRKIRKK